jgi:hypothetical protein
MKQTEFDAIPSKAGVNPVLDPQILPLSYAIPVCTVRFSSPAASACVSPGFLALFFKKKPVASLPGSPVRR